MLICVLVERNDLSSDGFAGNYFFILFVFNIRVIVVVLFYMYAIHPLYHHTGLGYPNMSLIICIKCDDKALRVRPRNPYPWLLLQ